MKMLQMDVNPGGWITEQRRKSALFWENSVLIQLKMWCWLQLWLSYSRVVVAFLSNTISAPRWKLQWFMKPYLNLNPMCCILLVPRVYIWPMNKSFSGHSMVFASSVFWLHPKEQTFCGFLQWILGRILVWWQDREVRNPDTVVLSPVQTSVCIIHACSDTNTSNQKRCSGRLYTFRGSVRIFSRQYYC